MEQKQVQKKKCILNNNAGILQRGKAYSLLNKLQKQLAICLKIDKRTLVLFEAQLLRPAPGNSWTTDWRAAHLTETLDSTDTYNGLEMKGLGAGSQDLLKTACNSRCRGFTALLRPP